jgi:hypothetical protein
VRGQNALQRANDPLRTEEYLPAAAILPIALATTMIALESIEPIIMVVPRAAAAATAEVATTTAVAATVKMAMEGTAAAAPTTRAEAATVAAVAATEKVAMEGVIVMGLTTMMVVQSLDQGGVQVNRSCFITVGGVAEVVLDLRSDAWALPAGPGSWRSLATPPTPCRGAAHRLLWARPGWLAMLGE